MERKQAKKTHKTIYAETVSTEVIQLVDKAGNMRVRLDCANNGLPLCQFFGNDLLARISLGLHNDESVFATLQNVKGNVQVVARISVDGQVGISVLDEESRPVFWAGVDLNGDRHITLFNNDGSVSWNTAKDPPAI